jgi:hypothetical protein
MQPRTGISTQGRQHTLIQIYIYKYRGMFVYSRTHLSFRLKSGLTKKYVFVSLFIQTALKHGESI